jgi:hypothetical protein
LLGKFNPLLWIIDPSGRRRRLLGQRNSQASSSCQSNHRSIITRTIAYHQTSRNYVSVLPCSCSSRLISTPHPLSHLCCMPRTRLRNFVAHRLGGLLSSALRNLAEQPPIRCINDGGLLPCATRHLCGVIIAGS